MGLPLGIGVIVLQQPQAAEAVKHIIIIGVAVQLLRQQEAIRGAGQRDGVVLFQQLLLQGLAEILEEDAATVTRGVSLNLVYENSRWHLQDKILDQTTQN